MEEIEKKQIYYRILFKQLRAVGEFDAYRKRNHIPCRRGESVVDALVRLGHASHPWHAVDLIADDANQDIVLFAREIADLDPSS